MLDLSPRLKVMLAEALSEVAQEVHQPKGCQEFMNLLILGVPYTADVRAQFTYYNMVST